MQPAKGYSITFDGYRGNLRTPVVDDRLHAAAVPLGAALRVVGTAEFAGYDRHIDPDRIRNLLQVIRQILPHEPFDQGRATPWCGLRRCPRMVSRSLEAPISPTCW